MPAPLTAYWNHTDECPIGRSFGEAFDWHLVYNETRPYQGEAWVFWQFSAVVHGKSPKGDYADFDNETKKLIAWRQGKRKPDRTLALKAIELLFSDDPALSDWKQDLERSLDRRIVISPFVRDRSGGRLTPENRTNVSHPQALADAPEPLSEHVQSIRGDVQHVSDTQTEHSEMLRFLVAAEMARRGEGFAKSGVTDEAVIRLAKRISEQVESSDHALAELGAALDELLQLRADSKRGSNLDADVEAVLRRIDERANAEKFEDADSEAERAFRNWELREAEERAIGLLFAEENIRTKRLLRDAAGAAFWIAKRVAFIAGTHFAEYDELKLEIDKYADSGFRLGNNIDLEIALLLVKDSSINGENDILLREELNVYAAILLLDLGRRQTNKASVEEAVAVLRRAAVFRTPSNFPFEWARRQNLLGEALVELGERQEGTALLDEALTAFRSALEVYTRADSPIDWAMTQSNLGGVLAALGERQEGTALLDAAVSAFRSALEVYTLADSPLDWAMMQSNLGGVLAALGERHEGIALLDAAAAASRSALEIFTRSDWPLNWAMTQNNLGLALSALGKRGKKPASLKAAVAAYRSALEVRTRDDLPLDWAATQNNLGAALHTLGEQQEETESLEAAVVAYRLALEVRTCTDLPVQCAVTQSNLERTLALIVRKQE